jgi:hypothetical protein
MLAPHIPQKVNAPIFASNRISIPAYFPPRPTIKKTLINSVIERLEVGGGEIIHLKPRPWAKPFF